MKAHVASSDRFTVDAAVRCRTNAELIAYHVAPLYGLNDVLDVTYGRGRWWTIHRPERLICHDKELDGVDFRCLPESTASQQCVAFDPPYIPGVRGTSTLPDFIDRYGLSESPRTHGELRALIRDGLEEIRRVLVPKGLVLVKCMNYVNSKAHRPQVAWTIADAEALGFTVETQYVHLSGRGPYPAHNATPRSPRANYSVLVVLRSPSSSRDALPGQLALEM